MRAEIKYNAEGDLLFSASKDDVINVWHSHNGERLGTYNGHNGSVWTVDPDGEFFGVACWAVEGEWSGVVDEENGDCDIKKA